MQYNGIATHTRNPWNKGMSNIRAKGCIPISLLLLTLVCVVLTPQSVMGAERHQKKAVLQKENSVVINNTNLRGHLTKADELFKKGQFDGALKIYVKTYEYTKELLTTVRIIKSGYEKHSGDPSIAQADKEELFIKLRRIGQLITRYEDTKQLSAFRAGLILAKKGDTERARRYLSEVIETAPYSTHSDSLWMKSKTLLLSLSDLEGEF